jgi:crossover junction endodeoxyribonuclease RuvC
MIILGIDPGTINCGYCVMSINKNLNHKLQLLEIGVIKSKSKDLIEQIVNMEKSFSFIFNKHQIDEVSIEDIFFAHNPKTVIKLAQFRGAILLKLAQELNTNIPNSTKIFQYTPLQVKKALTGNGKSTKEQVAFMVKKILKLKAEIKPLDITDAIAVAITHSQQIKYSNIRK